MSDEIKELAKRLRHSADTINQPGGILLPSDWRDAASALEAMAEEVESLNDALNEWVRENAPGGWIDALRKKAQERDQLAEEANTLIKTKNGLAELSAQKETRAEASEAERDRLKAALVTIANTIDGFEGRGDYVTYVSFSLDTRKAAKHCGGDA